MFSTTISEETYPEDKEPYKEYIVNNSDKINSEINFTKFDYGITDIKNLLKLQKTSEHFEKEI